MKRRQFLQSVAAAGVSPALPRGGLAGGLPVPEAVYERAVYLTRLWGRSVPEMYTSALGLDLPQATAVFRRLVGDGVMAAPNASGMAAAARPFFKASVAVSEAAGSSGTQSDAARVRGLIDRVLRDRPGDVEAAGAGADGEENDGVSREGP